MQRKKKNKNTSDLAAKSNNIFIVYFIIHLWMCSGRINRKPWEKTFARERYYEQAKSGGRVS